MDRTAGGFFPGNLAIDSNLHWLPEMGGGWVCEIQFEVRSIEERSIKFNPVGLVI